MVGVIAFDSNRFVMREYSVSNEKVKRDYRFLVISDLHCKKYGKNNEKLFTAINSISADACLLCGDMITAKNNYDYDSVEKLILKINEKMPVFYEEGNHEQKAKFPENKCVDKFVRFENNLKEKNIKIMNNESVEFEDFVVYSLSQEKSYYKRGLKMVMTGEYLEKKFGECKKDKATILLAHDPEYFDAYSEFGVDFTFSGHFHGGIAIIPGIGGVISPRLHLFPKYSGGIYEKDGKKMILSRGLGSHSIPIRFNNPGEIVLVNIKRS